MPPPAIADPTLSRLPTQPLPIHPRSSFEEEDSLASSVSALDLGPPADSASEVHAPRPTFRKLTIKRKGRNGDAGAEVRASVTKVSFEQTLAMYRANALKSDDGRLKYEFAKYCIEESEKAPDQKIKDTMMEEGFALLKELSKSGNADAMYTLGQAYMDDGQHSLAYAQLLAASKRSQPGAMYLLAKCAERGLGTKKSSKVALDFYTKSAQAGFKPAIYRLAMIELRGELGGKRDVRKAVMWLKRGAAVADKENPQCLYQLAVIYENGIPPQVQQDENYARGLLIEAAGLEYAPAQYKLGCCYEFAQVGCPKDLVRRKKRNEITCSMMTYAKALELICREKRFIGIRGQLGMEMRMRSLL